MGSLVDILGGAVGSAAPLGTNLVNALISLSGGTPAAGK